MVSGGLDPAVELGGVVLEADIENASTLEDMFARERLAGSQCQGLGHAQRRLARAPGGEQAREVGPTEDIA